MTLPFKNICERISATSLSSSPGSLKLYVNKNSAAKNSNRTRCLRILPAKQSNIRPSHHSNISRGREYITDFAISSTTGRFHWASILGSVLAETIPFRSCEHLKRNSELKSWPLFITGQPRRHRLTPRDGTLDSPPTATILSHPLSPQTRSRCPRDGASSSWASFRFSGVWCVW